jgi:putative CocE/NonD family hydrolase
MNDHPSAVAVEFDVPTRMRDGVTLRANVYRPEGTGPWPTLLARTPYGKDLAQHVSWLDPVQAARRGFLVVVQDTRGRYASDGVWDPFRFERQDGYDAVEWAAKLPGSNGRIGMYGGSYWGNSQWLAAAGQPPSLAAISPSVTWSDPMDGLFARGGAVELGLVVPWSLEQGLDYLRRTARDAAELRRRVTAVLDEWDRLDTGGYWDLPVHDIEVLRRHGVPDLGSIRALDDPSIAEWCRVRGYYDRVDVPTFHIGGWYDIFVQGTLDSYQAMAARRGDARLIVGPWTHPGWADPIGEQLFGIRAAKDGVPAHPCGDVNDFQLAWLRGHLDPGADITLPEAPVRIFVMGRNEWRDERCWPPSRAVRRRWYLHASGGLGNAVPDAEEEQSSQFTYDPLDPVPTVGGNTVMWPGYPGGPMNQARVEARRDVIVFTSAPLADDVEVTGRVLVVLHAASSAPSTDWVARLCDVHPDGRSVNICDGITRVSSAAGECGRHEIDLWSTSNVFLRGHRIRVDVTSSSFPRWDRNLNTGNQRDSRWQTAQQRIYHAPARPSYIELPVIG